MRYIFYILFFLLTVSTLTAQKQVRAVLDTTAIVEGSAVKLRLQIADPNGVGKVSSRLSDLMAIEGLEVQSQGAWQLASYNGQEILEQQINLIGWDSGYYFIPAIAISFNEGGRNISQPTGQLALTVNPVEITQMEIAPIKDIIEEPLRFSDFLPYLIGLLIVGLLIGAFLFYRNRKNKQEAPPPPVIILPAHEIALNKLKELKIAKLWQQGQVKEYISELTYIVREYLENRYDVQALESTSVEILKDLKKKEIVADHRDQLREMFTMADLVKFAKAEPPVDANSKLMDYAENFVIRTKKIKVEPETKEPEPESETNS